MIKNKSEWAQQYITVIYKSKEHVFRVIDTDALYKFTNTKHEELLDSKKITTALLDSFRVKEISLNSVSEKELLAEYGLELINK
ncbi:hypothetical protein FGL74_04325 [Leuconostoc koreense]|nr:hypothetical protein FGL74_04325 [Leuconostoc mesenteroides]QGM24882.1 hypothetical protein GJV51_02300 [Leuconostoc mesenteroides subsp. mesenteroides]